MSLPCLCMVAAAAGPSGPALLLQQLKSIPGECTHNIACQIQCHAELTAQFVKNEAAVYSYSHLHMKAAGKKFLDLWSCIIQLLKAAGIIFVLTVILEVLHSQAMKFISSGSNFIFFPNVIKEALLLLPMESLSSGCNCIFTQQPFKSLVLCKHLSIKLVCFVLFVMVLDVPNYNCPLLCS